MSKRYKPNGKREVARRIRQIKQGILKRYNGLKREKPNLKG